MKLTKGFVLTAIVLILGFGTSLPLVLLAGCRYREPKRVVGRPVSSLRGVQAAPKRETVETPLYDLKHSPMAQIVGECRIAPAAGNGLLPIAATVDTRRDRAIVLCQDTRNLAVVDLRRARLMRVVPLPEYHPDLSSMAIMTYEPHTDTLLIVAWEYLHGHFTDDTTQVITLDARMLRVIAVSRLQGGGNWASHTALIAVDGATQELFVPRFGARMSATRTYPPHYYLQVFDIRSLRHKRLIRLWGQMIDIAWNSRTHALVTLEERDPDSSSDTNVNMRRLFVRSAYTGKVLNRSIHQYESARSLMVDAARNCVLFLYARKDGSEDIACLGLPSLREMSDRVSTLRKRLTGYVINDTEPDRDVVDAVRRRIYLSSHITDLNYEIRGTMAGAWQQPSTLAVSMDGRRLASVQARLASVWPRGDEALVFYGHALAALDGKTLRERWRVSIGDRIQGIMVDRQRHTVLAWGEGDSPDPWLVWAGGTRSRYAGSYGKKGPGFGKFDYTGAYLYGKSIEWYPSNAPNVGDRLFGLVVGGRPQTVYELLFPDNTDLDAPAEWIGVCVGNQLVRHVDIHHKAFGVSLVYIPGTDTLLYAIGRDLCSLSGKTLRLPKGTPDPWNMSAADAQGRYLYCTDQSGRLIYRIRLSDGAVVAARRLSFECTDMVADAGAGILYLADEQDGTVVRIRAF